MAQINRAVLTAAWQAVPPGPLAEAVLSEESAPGSFLTAAAISKLDYAQLRRVSTNRDAHAMSTLVDAATDARFIAHTLHTDKRVSVIQAVAASRYRDDATTGEIVSLITAMPHGKRRRDTLSALMTSCHTPATALAMWREHPGLGAMLSPEHAHTRTGRNLHAGLLDPACDWTGYVHLPGAPVVFQSLVGGILLDKEADAPGRLMAVLERLPASAPDDLRDKAARAAEPTLRRARMLSTGEAVLGVWNRTRNATLVDMSIRRGFQGPIPTSVVIDAFGPDSWIPALLGPLCATGVDEDAMRILATTWSLADPGIRSFGPITPEAVDVALASENLLAVTTYAIGTVSHPATPRTQAFVRALLAGTDDEQLVRLVGYLSSRSTWSTVAASDLALLIWPNALTITADDVARIERVADRLPTALCATLAARLGARAGKDDQPTPALDDAVLEYAYQSEVESGGGEDAVRLLTSACERAASMPAISRSRQAHTCAVLTVTLPRTASAWERARGAVAIAATHLIEDADLRSRAILEVARISPERMLALATTAELEWLVPLIAGNAQEEIAQRLCDLSSTVSPGAGRAGEILVDHLADLGQASSGGTDVDILRPVLARLAGLLEGNAQAFSLCLRLLPTWASGVGDLAATAAEAVNMPGAARP